jgi:hypothetical protein
MGVRIPGDTNGEAPPRLSKLVLQTFLLRQFSVDRAYVVDTLAICAGPSCLGPERAVIRPLGPEKRVAAIRGQQRLS